MPKNLGSGVVNSLSIGIFKEQRGILYFFPEQYSFCAYRGMHRINEGVIEE